MLWVSGGRQPEKLNKYFYLKSLSFRIICWYTDQSLAAQEFKGNHGVDRLIIELIVLTEGLKLNFLWLASRSKLHSLGLSKKGNTHINMLGSHLQF